MNSKSFILLICVVIGLLVFGAVSCSKRLNPFIPNSGSGNGGGENAPEWFLPPEE